MTLNRRSFLAALAALPFVRWSADKWHTIHCYYEPRTTVSRIFVNGQPYEKWNDNRIGISTEEAALKQYARTITIPIKYD